MSKNLADFLATYDPDGTRVKARIRAERDKDGNSPFIVVEHGSFTAVLTLMPFDGDKAHLCIDVHPFVDGEDATEDPALATSDPARTGQRLLPVAGREDQHRLSLGAAAFRTSAPCPGGARSPSRAPS